MVRNAEKYWNPVIKACYSALIVLGVGLVCAQPLSSSQRFSLNSWTSISTAFYQSHLYRESHNSKWLENDDVTAFRANVGSIYDNTLLVHQETRVIAPVNENLLIRFRYKHHEENNDKVDRTDRLEMEWRGYKGLTAGILASAFHEKEDMDFGGAIGFRTGQNRYVRFYYIAHRWLYNEKSKEENYYSKFPHRFLIEGRYDPDDFTRIYLELFYEAPWKLERRDSDRYTRGYEYSISGRLEKHSDMNLWGIQIVKGKRYYSTSYDLEKNTKEYIIVKPFYYKKGFPWSWEIDVPWEYRLHQELYESLIFISRKEEKKLSHLYPQGSLRRHWGRMFFTEFLVMPQIRSFRQISSDPEEGLWQRGTYLYLGASTGIVLHGGSITVGGKNRSLPKGEIRFRAIHENNKFGGSLISTMNILMVLTW